MTTKIEKLSQAIKQGSYVKLGNLQLYYGEIASTYNVRLAFLDPMAKTCYVNTAKYSVTSSKHRNLVKAAAKLSGYKVEECKDEADLLEKISAFYR